MILFILAQLSQKYLLEKAMTPYLIIRQDAGKLTIDATGASKPGEYIVSKNMYGDVKVLQEVVNEQEVSVGKRQKIQYRDFEFRAGRKFLMM